jgi:UDP-glucose 4-epimerase
VKGKKVVITGGAGFIGSNLARTLASSNDVRVIDDLSTGNYANIADLVDSNAIHFIQEDISQENVLSDLFHKVDVIFHQAAIPSVPRSIEDPFRSNKANVTGTLNVLIAAKEAKVNKVIYASSSSVYGESPTLPKKESMPVRPLSPYAVSKVTGELYCNVFHQVYGLSTACLRYFNVFGRAQDPTSEYAAVIPKFILRVLNHDPPIIFGDGRQTRDFTFVDDVVQANILAAEHAATGVFNIASGSRITITTLASTIMKLIGHPLEPIYDKPRPGDIKHSLADISKAHASFSYSPQKSLEKGLEETITWFQQQPNTKK